MGNGAGAQAWACSMFNGKQTSYECGNMGKQQLLKQTYLKLIIVDDFRRASIIKKRKNVYAKVYATFALTKYFHSLSFAWIAQFSQRFYYCWI